MNKYEKMWKLLRMAIGKWGVENTRKVAKWSDVLLMMNRVEREINVHEEAKTDVECDFTEARFQKPNGQNV